MAPAASSATPWPPASDRRDVVRGQFTARLAVDRDRFAGLAVAAGNLVVPAAAAPGPLSIAYSVGAVDDRVTVVTGGQPLPADASIFELGFFADLRDQLLRVTQLGPGFETSERQVPTGRLVTFRFADSQDGASNELLFSIAEGLPHRYPDYMPALLWDFFTRHGG